MAEQAKVGPLFFDPPGGLADMGPFASLAPVHPRNRVSVHVEVFTVYISPTSLHTLPAPPPESEA